MNKPIKNKSLVYIIMALFVLISLCVPYNVIFSLQENSLVSREEIEKIADKNNLLFTTNFVKISADNDKSIDDYVVQYKLFNLFTIKSVKVNVIEDKVLPGGNCIGLSLDSKGVVLIGSNFVITKKGTQNPIASSALQIGDIILEMNGTPVNNISDISSVLEGNTGQPVEVLYKRNNEKFTTMITPALDFQSKTYKLGLWIRDNALGVGTLTFVKENLRYGSLGHAINDEDTKQCFDVSDGQIYNCSVVGVKKGQKGTPGELIGLFMLGDGVQGDIDKNCPNGVYGEMLEDSVLLQGKEYLPVGGRLTVKPGKAHILCCTEGQEIKKYEIEIIKTYQQNSSSDKSMIIKVTDPELLAKTGGIVQGMSGSPIIQNGNIIGAVTHVFINDPTQGFGLYLDWMLIE